MNKLLIFGGLAALAGYLYWKNNKWNQSGSMELPEEAATPTPQPVATRSVFPLTIGSKGLEVRNIQLALIKRGGQIASSVLSTGGADGKWGPGTQKAIVAAGFPTRISEPQYKSIVMGARSVVNGVSLRGLLA